MTLTDAGALVALLDKNQPQNVRCRSTFPSLSLPLLTTWPALTEAMYLLYQIGGWSPQDKLWEYLEEGVLHLHTLGEIERQRMRQLMETYRDTPMDLADASLVVAAETLNLTRLFTLDSDFYVYRIKEIEAFAVVPSR